MIPREILKKIQQTELRTNHVESVSESARRWRAVFGGPPKASSYHCASSAEAGRFVKHRFGRAARIHTRAACAPHFSSP